MLEMYVLMQLAREPLQAIARRLMCQGLDIATQGRRQCHSCPGMTKRHDD
jgi:hypothetical protein